MTKSAKNTVHNSRCNFRKFITGINLVKAADLIGKLVIAVILLITDLCYGLDSFKITMIICSLIIVGRLP